MEKARGKNALGRLGEDLACDYLRALGHRILARNWRSAHLEIDLITQAPDGLHFAEIKSRTAPLDADPLEGVGPAKQKRITAAAQRFLNGLGQDLEVWFDVVSVVFDGTAADIQYYPGAWLPIHT